MGDRDTCIVYVFQRLFLVQNQNKMLGGCKRQSCIFLSDRSRYLTATRLKLTKNSLTKLLGIELASICKGS